ncbi:integrase catalytic domain-containing protein, partial [Maribellus luteus]|uniref:integrase catalytic domain-containing protein n=1 Tax=Maribellus luteus TaxID=2305463 RepID=UPI001F4E1989
MAKERSVPARRGVHVPRVTGNVGEKTYIDLVGFSNTPRGNKNILTVMDGFSRYACAYPIPNKEARTVAKALMEQHIPQHGVPLHIHSDNGLEFVNKLWVELLQMLNIKHTTTPPYNPSSNAVERWHRTLGSILRTMPADMQRDWDLSLGMAVFAYNTT